MNYDVIIIGSGPGGYVSAIRCAQLNLKTALIEKYTNLGGSCLNVGCIPSKALLDSSEHYYSALTSFHIHGIQFETLRYDWSQMQKRKDKVVADLGSGIRYLLKKNNIDIYEGVGSFENANTIIVNSGIDTIEKLTSKNVIIATGSKPLDIPSVKIDKKRIVSSTEMLSLEEVPQKLLIIGAGAIGVELGSLYARLGSEVVILEYMPSIIPTMDKTLSRELQKILKKMNIKINLEHHVLKAEVTGDQVIVTATNKNGEESLFSGDHCLMAVGRRPFTENLGLNNLNIKFDNRGFIQVNENLETETSGVYAIGDVIGGLMLAHKAESEGIFVAETIAGQFSHINYNAIPVVVYTWPEVAAVGFTEDQLKEKGIDYKTGHYTFRALGRAKTAQETDGIVKVLVNTETDQLLGVHMIGARAADMIAEAVVALEYKASAEDIAMISHAHPTFSEAFKEACLDSRF